jgi:putative transposase
MVVFLRERGHVVNRKRVQRLMREMGLAGMAPGPATSKPHPQHKVYPYLLRGVAVTRSNQVWSTDVTYIRLARGFAYLVAIIDWYSRCVLAWRISNSMDASFCVDCLEEALRVHGKPDVFNSDQGSQFTSTAFTGVLKREDVAISMDGRGRALDNIFVERLWRSVKYEDIYLKGYGNMAELTIGLAQYFVFYNGTRPHQSLGYRTPADVYRSGSGGGALIVDKYGQTSIAEAVEPCREQPLEDTPLQRPDERITGQRRAAAKRKTDQLKLSVSVS